MLDFADGRIAQTNLQLFNQLRDARYPHGDCLRIKDAYQLAACLFSTAFRPSGKAFLAHLVGTASTLAAVRARTPVIAAGLLHAAYASGRFGGTDSGMSGTKRERVRRVVGREIENLVARYTVLRWNDPESISAVRARLHTLEPVDRDVILVRLANELEDQLDLGALYCGDADQRRQRIKSSHLLLIAIAEELGVPLLASWLDRACRATIAAEVPRGLRGSAKGSFRIVPPSRWQWYVARLRHVLRRHAGGSRGGLPMDDPGSAGSAEPERLDRAI
jgi:(p)ppGpp synthase/HD superfamily hydrolase